MGGEECFNGLPLQQWVFTGNSVHGITKAKYRRCLWYDSFDSCSYARCCITAYRSRCVSKTQIDFSKIMMFVYVQGSDVWITVIEDFPTKPVAAEEYNNQRIDEFTCCP